MQEQRDCNPGNPITFGIKTNFVSHRSGSRIRLKGPMSACTCPSTIGAGANRSMANFAMMTQRCPVPGCRYRYTHAWTNAATTHEDANRTFNGCTGGARRSMSGVNEESGRGVGWVGVSAWVAGICGEVTYGDARNGSDLNEVRPEKLEIFHRNRGIVGIAAAGDGAYCRDRAGPVVCVLGRSDNGSRFRAAGRLAGRHGACAFILTAATGV